MLARAGTQEVPSVGTGQGPAVVGRMGPGGPCMGGTSAEGGDGVRGRVSHPVKEMSQFAAIIKAWAVCYEKRRWWGSGHGDTMRGVERPLAAVSQRNWGERAQDPKMG